MTFFQVFFLYTVTFLKKKKKIFVFMSSWFNTIRYASLIIWMKFIWRSVSITSWQAALALYGCLSAPMLGVFSLGMLFPWSNKWVGKHFYFLNFLLTSLNVLASIYIYVIIFLVLGFQGVPVFLNTNLLPIDFISFCVDFILAVFGKFICYGVEP